MRLSSSPDFAKYVAASRQVRGDGTLTPLVQPLSIDEAVLTVRHRGAARGAPAVVLARFAAAVEREVGMTVSIGLAATG